MIPEIPVGTWDKLDVWSHGDQSAALAQGSVCLVERPAQGSFVVQVLEEVADENDVEARLLSRPGLGAVLPDELHIGRQVAWRVGIEIHRIFSSGMNLIDELSVAATQIEDSCVPRHILLEKRVDEHAPDTLAVIEVRRKALGVDAAEISFVVGKRYRASDE